MSDFAQPLIDLPPSGAISTAGPESLVNQQALTATNTTYNATSSAFPAANLAIYQAVIVSQRVTVTHLGIFVQTASGNVDVGIYNEGGTRLVSSGSTAVSGSGALQSFDVTDTTLVPGLYWLACACSSASAIFRSSSAFAATPGTGIPTARACGAMQEASALPLPSTATFAAITTSSYIPLVVALLGSTF